MHEACVPAGVEGEARNITPTIGYFIGAALAEQLAKRFGVPTTSLRISVRTLVAVLCSLLHGILGPDSCEPAACTTKVAACTPADRAGPARERPSAGGVAGGGPDGQGRARCQIWHRHHARHVHEHHHRRHGTTLQVFNAHSFGLAAWRLPSAAPQGCSSHGVLGISRHMKKAKGCSWERSV